MNEQPTHLDLFSGIGGFALAAGWAGFKTIGFCEIEPYCQAVLKKHWPEVPIHKDIKGLRGGGYRGCALLTGGFPCQPFSQAGKRRGKDDDRHLWPEMLRIIEEAKPTWVVGENVAGIIGMELDKVCADLEAVGYEVWPLVIPACGVDAPHKRDRVWIVGHTKLDGLTATKTSGGLLDKSKESGGQITERQSSGAGCSPADVADSQGNRTQRGIFKSREKRDESRQNDNYVADSVRVGGSAGIPEQEQRKEGKTKITHDHRCGGSAKALWIAEPSVGRLADGIPNRVAKLRGLGNAIVPQVAYQIIKGIRELL